MERTRSKRYSFSVPRNGDKFISSWLKADSITVLCPRLNGLRTSAGRGAGIVLLILDPVTISGEHILT